MLDFELLDPDGIVRVHPETPLLARDFAQLSETVDRYLASHDDLKGLIISAENFPGWEDFSALVSHVKFVRGHHKNIRRVAAVSDDQLLKILPPIANHFTAAEVRHFDSTQLNDAMNWVKQ